MVQKINFQAQVNNLKQCVIFELTNLLNQSGQKEIWLTKLIQESQPYELAKIYTPQELLIGGGYNCTYACYTNSYLYKLKQEDSKWLVFYSESDDEIEHDDYANIRNINELSLDNLIVLYDRVYKVLNNPNYIELEYSIFLDSKKQ